MNSISQSLVKKISLIGIVITLSMLAVSAYAWLQLPAGAQIPAHWNAAGEVDRYAGKIEGLLFLPAISVGLFLLLALIPKIEPRKLNMQQSAKAYTAVAVIAGLIMMLIHVMTVATALGFKVAFAAVLTAAVGLLFIVMGNVMGKIRSNFMFGVRTPWTLTSELSWNKTNRMAGKLLMALGLLMLALVFMGTTALQTIYAVGGLLLAIVVWSCVYSYLVWRNDPKTQHA